jgi:2,3-bisphosphoglycerate-dependent phosphoglycerate mutase
MNKTIYLVRHAQAAGQAADAPLTSEGMARAEALAEFLSGFEIARIVSSPFERARQTIGPLSRRLDLEINLDDRLVEAVLSTTDHPDWLDKLRETFSDPELAFDGGESSRTATRRAIAAIHDALSADTDSTAVITHGRLLTLVLKHFDPAYGFDHWQALTTPDAFRVTLTEKSSQVDRLWQ